MKPPHNFRLFLENLCTRLGFGMRAKLIILFVIIKVVPLILLAFVAWQQAWKMGDELRERTNELTEKLNETLLKTGNIAVNDAVKALDDRATLEIERTSTDVARQVANFLYSRDADLLFAASLKPDANTYHAFTQHKLGRIIRQGAWALAPDQKSWQPSGRSQQPVLGRSSNKENDLSFHYRPADDFEYDSRPLYLEMTFVGLDGHEKIKVTTSERMDKTLKNVSQRQNTYVRAETYFQELKKLKPGEIYVSDVIGEYVGSRVIGRYIPESAAKAGEPFNPEASAWAGKENPLGKRFQGIVRWGTPVVQQGRIVGYVTLALDHDHLMEFTAHVMPTADRYTEIPDAFEGNYAFIWDHKGRSIVHPRHFSIAGYNAETGDPQMPWLEDRIYEEWKASGQCYSEFIQNVPTFVEQSVSKKPAKELTKQGLVGLDCRYLNFAPQCTGWFDLTRDGGSGSFVILWSGLRKLTTAAAIPYYTGQYAASGIGFGFVAIGASLEDFHRPATETKEVLDSLIAKSDRELSQIAKDTQRFINDNLMATAIRLSVSTLLMVILVIVIAIWMASAFTHSITELIQGISRFRSGERHFRFNNPFGDEIGTLANSFDAMADSLVDSVKSPLVITDTEKNIRYVNELGLKRLNRNLEDVLDKPYAAINTLYAEGSPHCPFRGLAEGHEPDVFFHEPTQSYFQDVAAHFNDKDGNPIGYVVRGMDLTEIITHQKRIEEQRTLLDSIFNTTPDLISYEDQTGRYLAVNARFAAVTGQDPRELTGRTAREALPESLAIQVEKQVQTAILQGSPLIGEEQILFADGHSEILDSVRTPVYNVSGELTGLLTVSRDVTRRVDIETELRKTQEELQNAVLTANRANESKSEFLARMSHEIRTPMNAIIGMSTIALRKLDDPATTAQEIQDQVLQIEVSSQHLLSLINDILDISKIEAGKIELEAIAFDLSEVVNAVDAIIRPRCQEKGVTFEVLLDQMSDTHFIGDPLRLRQVLINLLGNAVKFTPKAGTVTLQLHELTRQGTRSHVAFAVQDTGIGIAEDQISRLFQPFEQGGTQISREYGGTGLGLSISYRIVHLMGGDIEVQSVPGQGSTFNFALWFEEATASAPDIDAESILAAAGQNMAGKRVLLVDDVHLNRLIVTNLLEPLHLVLEEAENGRQAFEKFAQSSPDFYSMILMDALMPVLDGYEATKAIRALDRPDARTVPIIAMTANAFKDDVQQALDSGMNDHLAKPLDLEKLMQLMRRYLGEPPRVE